MLSLALGKGKTDFQTVRFVFLVDVFHEGLEVFSGFSGFVSHVIVLITDYGFQKLIITYIQALSQMEVIDDSRLEQSRPFD